MTDPTKRLLALLDEEQNALMTGDYALLDGFAAQKLAFVEALSLSPPHAPLMQQLCGRMQRNEVLIRAARDGFRDAIQSLSNRRAETHTALYHSDGTAQITPNCARTIERKA